MDKLLTPIPVVKKLITKSSIDKVNDISSPEIIPGFITGKITFLNIYPVTFPFVQFFLYP